MSNTYCAAAFKHIYTESDDRYKLCCYSEPTPSIAKYKPTKHTPFEFFNSEEMEDIRTQMIAGQPVDGCQVCYKMEQQGLKSYRTTVFNSDKDRVMDVEDVELKLRLFGSACNLSCVMCFPMNSSTRRKEVSQLTNQENIFKGLKDKQANIKRDHFERTVEDLLANIDKISRIKFTGGEPLIMPRHWDFLFSIPEQHRKRLQIRYDTNFTTLSYKNHHVDDILASFPNTRFSVSCDHFGDKLSWIRYPIDVKQFEHNLRDYSKHIHRIQVTVSLFNAMDLEQIKAYYDQQFGIIVHAPSVVIQPDVLSIRNFTDDRKQLLRSRWKSGHDHLLNELNKEQVQGSAAKFDNYIEGLNKIRTFKFSDVWSG